MVSVERTGERCPVRDDFTLAGHIESERHPGKQAVEVVVRMIPGAADGVRRERWLEVVSERQLSEREVEMTLQVHSIEAAAWWVLSRAGTVEAVAPEALRSEVATQAEALAKKHREPISS